MTTEEEGYRSLEQTRQFLFDLLNPQVTKRVPREIRKRASRCLKHYPLVLKGSILPPGIVMDKNFNTLR